MSKEEEKPSIFLSQGRGLCLLNIKIERLNAGGANLEQIARLELERQTKPAGLAQESGLSKDEIRTLLSLITKVAQD